jgi:hypothetical protein
MAVWFQSLGDEKEGGKFTFKEVLVLLKISVRKDTIVTFSFVLRKLFVTFPF